MINGPNVLTPVLVSSGLLQGATEPKFREAWMSVRREKLTSRWHADREHHGSPAPCLEIKHGFLDMVPFPYVILNTLLIVAEPLDGN